MGGGILVVIEIVVERSVLVIALDQAAARRVIPGRGQRQAGVLAQAGNGLHQALSEALLADHQSAVMILDRAGNDFRGRSRPAIDDHHQGHGDAAIAAHRVIAPLLRRAPVMRHDQLVLVQEHVGNRHGFVQQAAGISAQVENQPVELGRIQLLERRGKFGIGGFIEPGKLDVPDAGLQHETRCPRNAWEFHRA